MKKIKLTQGKFALVDDDVYELYHALKWRAIRSGKNFYAGRSIRIRKTGYGDHRTVFMHKIIMLLHCKKPFNGAEIDHINGNGLDNRIKNLRWVTHSQNHMNESKRKNTKSKYKGVHWHNRTKKWWARITDPVSKKRLSLGLFKSEELAGLAYNNAAKKFYGEYSRLNKI